MDVRPKLPRDDGIIMVKTLDGCELVTTVEAVKDGVSGGGVLAGSKTAHLPVLARLLLNSHWCSIPCNGFSVSLLAIPLSGPSCVMGLPQLSNQTQSY